MHWDGTDFWIVGALILLGLSIFFIANRFVKKRSNKGLLLVFIVILVFLVWVELGVGIFGTPLGGD